MLAIQKLKYLKLHIIIYFSLYAFANISTNGSLKTLLSKFSIAILLVYE